MDDVATRPTRGALDSAPARVSHLVELRRRRTRRWPHILLLTLFVGYLTLGKGFAYFGVPPIFIGEVSMVALVAVAFRSDLVVPKGPSALVAGVLVAAGGFHAAVDLLFTDISPVETLRGFAFVYYAAFAVLVHGALADRESHRSFDAVLDELAHRASRAMRFVLPVLALLSLRLVGLQLPTPTWPGSGMPLLLTKPTDISVALAVCLPFVRSGLVSARRTRVALASNTVLAALWLTTAILVAARSRGAILAIAVGLMFTFGVRVSTLVRVGGAVVLFWLTLRVTGFSHRVGNRELSARGLTDAVIGIVRPDAASDQSFSATTNWRTAWWSAILHDTWRNHEWFRGAGWGTNLATKYGVTDQYTLGPQFVALRLPHNFVIGLIGRVGVAISALFVMVPALALLRTRPSRLSATVVAHPVRRAVQAGLVAQIAVGLTDVYLESPQGAIVFWMLLGALWWIGAPRAHTGSASAAS